MSQQVTKDMTFAQVMRMHPDVVKVLAKYNLGCVGCMGARTNPLSRAAMPTASMWMMWSMT